MCPLKEGLSMGKAGATGRSRPISIVSWISTASNGETSQQGHDCDVLLVRDTQTTMYLDSEAWARRGAGTVGQACYEARKHRLALVSVETDISKGCIAGVQAPRGRGQQGCGVTGIKQCDPKRVSEWQLRMTIRNTDTQLHVLHSKALSRGEDVITTGSP